MAILQRDRILSALQQRDIIIESTDPRLPFNMAEQVKSDTIDLRLGKRALVYKSSIGCVDTLASDADTLFDTISIPIDGYQLKPGNILFCSTLEVVCIANGSLQGRLSNRGTYSRFGISVNCGKLRFPAGTPGTPDIQISNHTSVPIRIYPFTYIAQMQIETLAGTAEAYDGVYPKVLGPVAPLLAERDRAISDLLKSWRRTTEPPEQEAAREIVEKLSRAPAKVDRKPSWLNIPPRTRAVGALVAGVLATMIIGYIVNMISQDDWTHWKIMSVTFAALLGVSMLALAIVMISADDPRD